MSIRFGTVGAPEGTPRSGTDHAIAYSRELGLDALEIAWVRSVRVKDSTCEGFRQTAEEHDISLSVHAPYYINLNSQTTKKMAASDKRLLDAARKGYLSGARDIIFHPGSYHDQPAEQVYERVKQKLIELTGILREEGVDVILRPETMGKSAMFGSLEEVVALSKAVEGVAPCIDVAHLHARPGDGSFNTYEEFAAMLKHVRAELGSLEDMHFHMSGIEYTEKGEKNHLDFDESDLEWRTFLRACVEYGVSGTIVTECPSREQETLKAQAVYQKELSHELER